MGKTFPFWKRTMKRLFIFVILSLGLAPAAKAACNINLTPFPITMDGSQTLIAGKINGEPVRFIADSGAFFSMLSPAVAAQFKLLLRPINAPVYVGGIGGLVKPELTTVRQLSVGNLTVPNVTFLVGGGEVGHGAAGLLGQNFLRIADVEYDLANGVIRLSQPAGCAGQSLAYWAKSDPVSVLDLWQNPRADNHATISYATLNGARIKVMFDTGASTSFLSFAAARRAHIDPSGPGTEAGGYSVGIGRGAIKTRIAPVETFQIGGETIKHTRLRLGDEDLPDADMLIGVDFFLSHRIYVANSQGKIYFTYNGGPVFALEPQTTAPLGDTTPAPETLAADEPKNAVDFGRRGAGELDRLQYGVAIADLSRAHELAPEEPLYIYQRAEAYYASKQPMKALDDVNATLTLSPKDVDALILRARLRADADDNEKVIQDANTADALLPVQSDQRFSLARLYAEADDFERAWREYETWMRAHPDDAKRMAAFAGLCWVGALGGEHLGQAKSACDEVSRLVSDDSSGQTGRSLIEFRLRDYFAAFNDGRAAAKRSPKDAWALYAKGLGEMRLGKPYPDRTEQGKIDLAAAKAIDPKVVARAARLGLAP